jgi:hypothetical protein
MNYYIKENRLLNTMVIVFSLVIVNLVFLPIYFELTNFYTYIFTLSLMTTITVIVGNYIGKLINNYIKEHINRYKSKHINDFINYCYDDENFKENVLMTDIPIRNGKGEKYGTTNVYSSLTSKVNQYLNK